MPEETSVDHEALAAELQSAEDSLKAKIEKLYGKIDTTDFAGEFKALVDVHDKIISVHTELAALSK